ncbi:F0F1 ATP synthase subunit gamma [Amorphus orientalis]|uniref:ATP synthase gamma chain n=1 Tax=Amorphus orientalis TaxID=649198 RepID=A0AAE3VKW1_9HYPH|nr:F0F1 ATP synthase subunit gamma [Amorphus orientalis]MDQ0313880.1 F-type H+-transporting ATPase subunit gamma [Amorphus orientalis]
MASLKDLRNRITSVKSTQKITKAMQMVAAAKLRRAEEAAEAARPYSERMHAVLVSLADAVRGSDEAPKLMVGNGRDDTHLLVVCTADRGLCGAFNSSIVRLAREHARRLQASGKTVQFFCVGRKGYDILRREYKSQIVDVVELKDVRRISFADAQKIGEKLIERFDNGDYDVATLFFSQFKSVISQIPTAQQLIPADPGEEEDAAESETDGTTAVREYEPEESEILADLVPRNVSVQVLHALLENAASEQGARMSAMDNATRNAGEMIDKLTQEYNRTRQAQITKELIEIISGAEAL